jgi:Amiloride-sensitive sodium channel
MAATANIRSEARKLAETTSVRGIPRALKSTDPGLRAIWSVAVLVCLAVLCWQLSMVVIRYFRYDSSTLYTEGSGSPVSKRQ